jgi:predicted phosphodiesterase
VDAASKAFMHDLPFDLRFDVGEIPVHLVHGSPRKVNEYLFEDKPARLYERLARAETARALVFGHTHRPWVREVGGVLFVNCGSVGKPKDGDPRAAFAILAAARDELRVTIERVSYDAAAVAEHVRRAGLPPEYADSLLVAA